MTRYEFVTRGEELHVSVYDADLARLVKAVLLASDPVAGPDAPRCLPPRMVGAD